MTEFAGRPGARAGSGSIPKPAESGRRRKKLSAVLDRAPRVVGNYIVSSPIAVGGMASVHLAAMRDDRRRVYAVKRPHARFTADKNLRKMVLDEAKIAACVRHANVVPMHGAEVVGDDLMLVMDYVPGVTLAELAPSVDAPLPPALAARIMADALRGLHAAHDAIDHDGAWLRVVHRDVSPQNIHVGVDGVARILDFGIAKAAHRLHATNVGVLKGKLAYMSPEQVAGKAIDHRTDIYAAAVVLWELLTGRSLFQGTNDAHTVTRILKGCTTRPSELVASVPRELDAIVMRGLALRADNRFDTALDMARALDEVFSTGACHADNIAEWVQTVGAEELAEQASIQRRLESEPSAPAAASSDIIVANRARPTTGPSRRPQIAVSRHPTPAPARSTYAPPAMAALATRAAAYPSPYPLHAPSAIEAGATPSARRAPTVWQVLSSNCNGAPSRTRLIVEVVSVIAIVAALMTAVLGFGGKSEARRAPRQATAQPAMIMNGAAATRVVTPAPQLP